MANFFQDVIKKDARFMSAKRVADLALLEPKFRDLVREIIADAAEHGVKLIAFETYRSRERQMQLFNEGASKLKEVGVHHYGLACDLVRVVDGEPSWKGDFSIVGQLARAHGLIWGGDWGAPAERHTFVDPYHVQRCALSDQAKLFREEWYPSDKYVALPP
jgi:hypothetical protein